jgi:hypothetical protein
MGKLVIKYQGKQIGEVNLKLGDTRIGRKPGCDIVLNDAGVSGEHAVIKTVGMKSTIVDLDSTNGTFIETERVRQRELRHGEAILIGEHTLYYRDDPNLEPPALGKRAGGAVTPPTVQDKTVVLTAFAQLLGIDGKNKGKPVPLVKEEVVLENPGKNPARIYRTADGYLMQAQAGPGEPRLNAKPVPPGGQLLENGDIIDVAGTKYQFLK